MDRGRTGCGGRVRARAPRTRRAARSSREQIGGFDADRDNGDRDGRDDALAVDAGISRHSSRGESMNVALLHGADAGEAPEDPVLGQIEEALGGLGHDVTRVSVAGDIVPIIDAVRRADPGLVFNLAESFDGKSALESNVAAL